LHDGLVAIAPTLGAETARAAAIAQAEGAGPGLAALDALPGEALDLYQPVHALRGHLLQRLGRQREAAAAFDRAIGLSESPAVRALMRPGERLAVDVFLQEALAHHQAEILPRPPPWRIGSLVDDVPQVVQPSRRRGLAGLQPGLPRLSALPGPRGEAQNLDP